MRYLLLPILSAACLLLLLARPPRRREGLILAVLLPLLGLSALAAFRTRQEWTAGRRWLDVNRSTAQQLARFTEAPLSLAREVVRVRDEEHGGRFTSLAQIPSLSRRPRRDRLAIAEALKARDPTKLEPLLAPVTSNTGRYGLYPDLYARWARARLADPKLSLAHSPANRLRYVLGDSAVVDRIVQRRRWVPVAAGQEIDLASISAVPIDGLSLREPEEAAAGFRGVVLLLMALLLIVHLVLRWRAPAADGFLLPAFGGLGALSVIVLFGASSPLTDGEAPVLGHLLRGPAYLRQGWAVAAGLALMAVLGWFSGQRKARPPAWMLGLEKGSSAAFLWAGLAFSLLAANAMARAPLLGALGLLGIGATLGLGYRTVALKPAVVAVSLAILALFVARLQETSFSFLYIEGSKLALILFVASFCARHEDRLEGRLSQVPLPELLAAGLWYLACLALVLTTGDLGFLLLLWLPVGLVASLALRRFQPFLASLALLLAGCALVVALSPVLQDRLDWRAAFPERWQMLREPFSAASDQMANALYRVSSVPSVLMGTGLGNGHRAEAASDLNDVALPFYFEQMGLTGVLVVVLLFGVLLWRLCRIGMRHPHPFGRWIALTSAAVLGVQTLYMLGANAGLFPLTGLTLAPVASGAWGTLATGVLVALALGLSSTERQAVPGPRLRRMLACSFAAFALTGVLTCAQYARVRSLGERVALRPYAGPGGRGAHGNARLAAVLDDLPPGDLLVRRSHAGWEKSNLARIAWTERAEEPGAEASLEDDGSPQPSGPWRRRYLSGLEGRALAPLTGVRTAWGESYGNERALEELLTGVGSESLEALKPAEQRWTKDRALLRTWQARHSPWGPGRSALTPQPVRLTVLQDLQTLCYSRLRRVVSRLDRERPLPGGAPRQAVLAVVDPTNGDYLAAVQVPSYSPAEASRDWRALDEAITDAPSPLTDNLHYTERAPGSVAKINTIATLLQVNPSAAGRRFRCVGGRRVQGLPVACMTRRGGRPAAHGSVGLRDILKLSCNEGASQVAVAAGWENLLQTYTRLDTRTANPLLPSSGAERSPEERFKRYAPWIGYGQVLSLSVDEVMRSVAAIANGGHLVSPHWRTTSNAWSRRIWRPEVAESVAAMMAAANERGGTAYPVWRGSRRFPSKTGTAQANSGRSGRQENDAWFVAFGPWGRDSREPPRLALVLWVQAAETRIAGRPVGTGGMTAAEVGVPAILTAALRAVEH